MKEKSRFRGKEPASGDASESISEGTLSYNDFSCSASGLVAHPHNIGAAFFER